MKINVVSESEFTVQGHGVHTAYVELTNALKKLGCDVETNTWREADLTHIHTVGTYALRHLLLRPGKKIVSAHVVPDSFVGSLVGAKLWLPFARVYLRWFYNRADVIFAVSDETKRELVALGVKKPIEIVYNLIDTSRYRTTAADKIAARKNLGIAKDTWVLVGAGQVQPRKRIDSFIETAKKLPDMQFVWVGGMPFGKLAAEHKRMAEMIETAPENFSCTGVVKLEDVKQYYQAADAFWLPSEQETFGLVVVEAAAAGLPVVLRDIPDYNETFRDGAVMVTDETVSSALERLRTDTSFYERQRKLAKERIVVRFDSVEGAKRVEKIYEELLKA